MSLPVRDDTPLESDFSDIQKLFEDLLSFAESHPEHTFICADDPYRGTPRMGWAAFRESTEDEGRTWTITLNNLILSLPLMQEPLQDLMKTAAGRREHLKALVSLTRSKK